MFKKKLITVKDIRKVFQLNFTKFFHKLRAIKFSDF